MRSITALFLLALVSSSWAVNVADAIPGIKRAEVPKLLLSEIAAKIAAEGPLDDIYKMFDTLENQIRKEQVEHDSLSSKQQAECKLERDFRNKEIADANSALDRATQEKNACQTSLHQNHQQLKTNIKTQKDVENNLDIITQTRTQEKKQFDDRHGNFVAAIEAVDGGHKILKELYNGAASLIDLSRATVTMFHHGVTNGNAHHYVSLVGALAQLSANADLLIDKNILARVEDLFAVLRSKLENEMKIEEESESKAISSFEVAKAGLVAQLKSLKETEKVLRDQIANNQNCIVKANNIITMATTKKERNQNLLNDADKMCKNFEEEYKTATSQRKEELALVDKLREVCGAKLKFSKNVNARATQDKDQFAKYQNQAKISDSTPPKGRKGLGGAKPDAKPALVEVEEDEDADEPIDAAVDSVDDESQ